MYLLLQLQLAYLYFNDFGRLLCSKIASQITMRWILVTLFFVHYNDSLFTMYSLSFPKYFLFKRDSLNVTYN